MNKGQNVHSSDWPAVIKWIKHLSPVKIRSANLRITDLFDGRQQFFVAPSVTTPVLLGSHVAMTAGSRPKLIRP